ncbi:hypothetical protein [Streptomyces sp. NPDC002088]|uniref:hypothetical protein n=1 Tax=Streptomyces sp. NPDC002088 TaxID=3154665 RepID=UPI00332448AB
MTDERTKAYAAEAAVWTRLAGLLPASEDVDEVQGCWDIGEQEGGLDVLVGRLLELGLRVGESTRAEIAVMAEQWGVWDRLAARIVACPPDPEQLAVLRVFEDGAKEPTAVRDVLPEHPSADVALVPWITCVRCGRVLARAHGREPWGDLSYQAEAYVVFAAGGGFAPRVFDREEPGAVWAALAALRGAGACG